VTGDWRRHGRHARCTERLATGDERDTDWKNVYVHVVTWPGGDGYEVIANDFERAREIFGQCCIRIALGAVIEVPDAVGKEVLGEDLVLDVPDSRKRFATAKELSPETGIATHNKGPITAHYVYDIDLKTREDRTEPGGLAFIEKDVGQSNLWANLAIESSGLALPTGYDRLSKREKEKVKLRRKHDRTLAHEIGHILANSGHDKKLGRLMEAGAPGDEIKPEGCKQMRTTMGKRNPFFTPWSGE